MFIDREIRIEGCSRSEELQTLSRDGRGTDQSENCRLYIEKRGIHMITVLLDLDDTILISTRQKRRKKSTAKSWRSQTENCWRDTVRSIRHNEKLEPVS